MAGSVGAQLHDRDDAAVELEPERGQRDRLHVADDLLGRLAGVGQDVDLEGAADRIGHEAHSGHFG